MKNLIKYMTLITVCSLSQTYAMDLDNNDDSSSQVSITGTGGYLYEGLSGIYNPKTAVAILTDNNGNPIFFSNIKPYSQATTPPNLQYPYLRLELFATMPNPNYIPSSNQNEQNSRARMKKGAQKQNILLYGTQVTDSTEQETVQTLLNPSHKDMLGNIALFSTDTQHEGFYNPKTKLAHLNHNKYTIIVEYTPENLRENQNVPQRIINAELIGFIKHEDKKTYVYGILKEPNNNNYFNNFN